MGKGGIVFFCGKEVRFRSKYRSLAPGKEDKKAKQLGSLDHPRHRDKRRMQGTETRRCNTVEARPPSSTPPRPPSSRSWPPRSEVVCVVRSIRFSSPRTRNYFTSVFAFLLLWKSYRGGYRCLWFLLKLLVRKCFEIFFFKSLGIDPIDLFNEGNLHRSSLISIVISHYTCCDYYQSIFNYLLWLDLQDVENAMEKNAFPLPVFRRAATVVDEDVNPGWVTLHSILQQKNENIVPTNVVVPGFVLVINHWMNFFVFIVANSCSRSDSNEPMGYARIFSSLKTKIDRFDFAKKIIST